MANVNLVVLMGNVTRDPESRTLSNGTKLAKFGLAVNEVYTRDGEKNEIANFFDCTVFGKLADTVTQYVAKGQLIHITGRLRYSSWDKDGQKRSKVEVIVDRMQLMPKALSPSNGKVATPAGNVPNEDIPDDRDSDDSIPF